MTKARLQFDFRWPDGTTDSECVPVDSEEIDLEIFKVNDGSFCCDNLFDDYDFSPAVQTKMWLIVNDESFCMCDFVTARVPR